jgi:hypothetical protein
MRFVAIFVLAASIVLISHGQERKAPLTPQNIESLIRDRLPDEALAIEIRDRGVAPLLRWRDVRRLRALGIGPAVISALERFVEPLTLTLLVEPPMAGLVVSVATVGVAQPDRGGTTDSTGRVVIDGLRPGAYRVNLTPPRTHRFAEREILIGDEGSVEHIALMPAPARLSVLIQDARVIIGSLGSYNGPLRNLEISPGTYPVSVSRPGHLTYTTSVSVEPGEEKVLTPALKREPIQFPVVHHHKWARCWGTLLISDDFLAYRQSGGPGKDSFEVSTTQILSVGQWSKNQFEIVLKDRRKLHFAHGVLKTQTKEMAIMLEDIVDVRPIGPVIEAIRRVQQTAR